MKFKMIKIVNECCGCGLPCLGNPCPKRNVSVYFCDKCGKQIDGAVYNSEIEGDLCEDCMNELVKENAKDIFNELEDPILEYLGFVKER